MDDMLSAFCLLTRVSGNQNVKRRRFRYDQLQQSKQEAHICNGILFPLKMGFSLPFPLQNALELNLSILGIGELIGLPRGLIR